MFYKNQDLVTKFLAVGDQKLNGSCLVLSQLLLWRVSRFAIDIEALCDV